jgi:hypothetical protein
MRDEIGKQFQLRKKQEKNKNNKKNKNQVWYKNQMSMDEIKKKNSIKYLRPNTLQLKEWEHDLIK